MPALKPRRGSRFQPLRYFVVGLGLIFLGYYYLFHEPSSSALSRSKEAAANSTLGVSPPALCILNSTLLPSEAALLILWTVSKDSSSVQIT
jgi:hypothetical protein